MNNIFIIIAVLAHVDVGSRSADGGKRWHGSSGTVVFRFSRPECLQSTTVTLCRILTCTITTLHRRQSLAAFKRHYALRLAIAPEFFYCSYMCLFYVCALGC